MKTEVLPIEADWPAGDVLRRAAEVLRAGGLVAFPTETVYGLGAHALNPAAVERIYEVKGRPPRNPIIVHVSRAEQARELTSAWPEKAETLSQRWPAPLTLVLPRSPLVPDIVTAGAATVAIRVPRHPVAWCLLETTGFPVAAPSANLSNRLSPTLAEHVLADFDGRIDMVLDAGPCRGGLESTVLDLTCEPPRLLRPGLYSVAHIESLIGPVDQSQVQHRAQEPLPSPGMLARHYAPRTALEVSDRSKDRVQQLLDGGLKVGWLTFDRSPQAAAGLTALPMSEKPLWYASRLYAALHELDRLGLDRIIVEAPPQTDPWQAINDRLRRAATI